MIKKLLFLTISMILSGTCLLAQDENPGNYMTQIYKAEQQVAQKYVAYMSAVSHGKGAKKADKKREDLLKTIDDTRIKVNELPPFQKDPSMRDASVSYLKLMYSVMNEDYDKIVNMEEISEQSYDAMEAYMLAQEKANEKLQEAGAARDQAAKKFAVDHHVNLIEEKNGLSEKMEKIGKVSDYYNQLYLIFFKASKQESYLTEAVEKKNINGIEQNKNALLKYAAEGLAALDTLRGFESDKSVVTACKKSMEFFKQEAGTKINIVTDYLLKNDEFEKLKKAMDSKSAKDRTREDVDNFNKAVNDINKAVKEYNQTNQTLNEKRSEVYNNWNSSVQAFFDNHMPYAAG
ncbi:MAG TPA: hypothetical protein VK543_19440 [Puia sp.]|nr:hypothetical protein [Puia sp.]